MRIGRLLLVGGAAVTAWTAAGILRRRPQLAKVRPELRSPVLYAPLHLRGPRSLQVGRRLMAGIVTPVADGVQVSERRVEDLDGSTRVLVNEPLERQAPSGAVIWFHGGGMVMGRPEQAQGFASKVAAATGALVVNVDYRLAPEHPFPAGLDDAMRVLRWVHDRADDLGVDPRRIAVGGDSAGGGLAAALAQRARDEGGPPIRLQVLVYPMLDDRTVLRDVPADRGEFVWSPVSNRFAWTAYLGHPPDEAPERPYAAPARTEDLSGLPPAWIGVGDLDLFHDEDIAYAERLRAAGVACELRIEAGTYHASDNVAPTCTTSRAFREAMVREIGAHLGAVDA